MPTKASVEKERFWRERVEEHATSGWSIREFCEQRGLSAKQFYAWKARLKKRDGAGKRA